MLKLLPSCYSIKSVNYSKTTQGNRARSISALMDIWPETANLEQDGEVVEVDPEDVPIDSIIVIRPGDAYP